MFEVDDPETLLFTLTFALLSAFTLLVPARNIESINSTLNIGEIIPQIVNFDFKTPSCYDLFMPKFFSKFLLLFMFFLFLLAISDKNPAIKRLTPARNFYQKPKVTELKSNIKIVKPTFVPFNWTIEKVDEHLTKVALPPDPKMSTENELFEAMNNYRKAHNVSILQKSDLLCSIAQNRANEQLANGELDSHAGFEKYAKEQNEFSTMGEVLFGGVQPQYGVHIVEYGWDRSLTGHREAIGDPSWQYGCGGIAGYFAVFIFGTK